MPTSSKKKQTPHRDLFKSSIDTVKKVFKRTEYNPHESFRLTRRRDYVRPFDLPHPLLFIIEVSQVLWKHRSIFVPLSVIYIALYVLFVGLGSQAVYDELTSTIAEAGTDVFSGVFGPLYQSGVTLYAVMTNGLNATLTEGQQIFGVLLSIMVWLTTVWLLRNLLAGKKVKMRDGLYNAGTPLISSSIIVLIIILQLVPVGLAAVGYAAATSSGLIAAGGFEAMLFWVAAALLGILSLYWISSSFFALVIVTLPGMYPVKALKASFRILIGRRLRFLVRLLWMALFILASWVVVMLPVILFDIWFKSILTQAAWVPIVPVAILILTTYTIFWSSAYIYLLYRKVVDANEPA
jgi:hypothetical protein